MCAHPYIRQNRGDDDQIIALLLSHRLQQWASIEPALDQRPVLAGTKGADCRTTLPGSASGLIFSGGRQACYTFSLPPLHL